MKNTAKTLLNLSICLCGLATPAWGNAANEMTNALKEGEQIVVDRQRGHCLLCHSIAQIKAPFHGNLGPDLSNIGQRLTYAQIRARIADPKRFNPESIMPAYGQTDGFRQLAHKYQGSAILTEAELNAVSAYMASLDLTGGVANATTEGKSNRSVHD